VSNVLTVRCAFGDEVASAPHHPRQAGSRPTIAGPAFRTSLLREHARVMSRAPGRPRLRMMLKRVCGLGLRLASGIQPGPRPPDKRARWHAASARTERGPRNDERWQEGGKSSSCLPPFFFVFFFFFCLSRRFTNRRSAAVSIHRAPRRDRFADRHRRSSCGALRPNALRRGSRMNVRPCFK